MQARTLTLTTVLVFFGIFSQFAESADNTFRLPVLTVKTRISGKTTGSCSYLPLSVSVTDTKSPLRISFSDDTPNGSGETIRNSLWTAALIAGLQKESPLQGVRISLDFKGGIDGPSAGAVMCLGIMTALDGRDFPEDFAMTGTILPDGTVGLVGGVAEKLKAAAKNPKIKRVAIPAFLRFEKDAEGNWTDLHELGRSLGLDLRPVESIGDAYCFLHREARQVDTTLSALSICHESSEFEAKAAEIFKKRDAALWTRIGGFSSNEVERIANSWEWRDYINPEIAEQRFAEGAIFDALNLIARADASLSAYKESWKFLEDYYTQFVATDDKTRGFFSISLSEKEISAWPIEKQLAFVDGFRDRIEEVCERVLGWRSDQNDAEEEESAEKEDSWRGFIPETGSSDLSAQLLTMVENARAEGQYRYMLLQTSDRSQLQAALQSGEQSISDEVDYDRKKLFFLLREQFRQGSFQDVPLPILNCGPEVDSALELFRKAWTITDAIIESDVLKPWAARASAHEGAVREHLMGTDHGFAVYDAARNWGTIMFMLNDEAQGDGVEFSYPSWTSASLMFYCAELFAEASAQLLKLDNDTDNASFMAFVMDRARMNALQSMEACRKAGIPRFRAVMSFQKAERDRASGSGSAADVLSEYWKATMFAKALVMAFRDGVGPEKGFTGYPAPPEEMAAIKANEALFSTLFNADFKPLLESLPTSWVKAISDVATVIAQKTDDETWNAFREVVGRAGVLLIKRADILAELIMENGDVEEAFLHRKEDYAAMCANWGGRLLGFYSAATRESIAQGGLTDALLLQKRGLKDGNDKWRTLPLPEIKARMKSDGTVVVTTPELDGNATIPDLFDVSIDVFAKVDGKMVLSDLISVFENCAAWRNELAQAMDELGTEEIRTFIPVLQSISAMLKKAGECSDKASFAATFENFELPDLFQ